jgi:iron complex transport system ATP-binding protein
VPAIGARYASPAQGAGMVPVVLEARGLTCGYGALPVLTAVDLCLSRGETIALLGRNGSGKSTLIRTLAGVLPALSGSVTVDGLPIKQHDRRALSRRLAVVPQKMDVPFAFSVREIVELGRAPHARFLGLPNEADARAVESALNACDLQALSAHPFQQISGGEQQRVALAMALAQEPEILLLDEPTVHLDLSHQVSLLDLVRRLRTSRGLGVIAAMHDVNLSALYFDRILLLGEGAPLAMGTPLEVLTAAAIERAFSTRVEVFPHPRTGTPQIVLVP